jgi:hypothetical protein
MMSLVRGASTLRSRVRFYQEKATCLADRLDTGHAGRGLW